MKARDVMTRDVQTIAPDDTIHKAAGLMDKLNVGALPVCDGQRLVGIVSDRDITVRATSAALPPDQCRITEVMTTDPYVCFEDDPVIELTRLMGARQIRRLPVLDSGERLVGMVSLGDLATDAKDTAAVHSALEEISMPSHPDRPAVS